jgi:hypothetical protein
MSVTHCALRRALHAYSSVDVLRIVPTTAIATILAVLGLLLLQHRLLGGLVLPLVSGMVLKVLAVAQSFEQHLAGRRFLVDGLVAHDSCTAQRHFLTHECLVSD